MLRLFVTYTFPDKASRDGFFECVCEDKIAKIVMKEEGCLRYEYELPAEDNVLLLHEEWETKEHQQEHLNQPTMTFIKGYKVRFHAETNIEVLKDENAVYPDPNEAFPNPIFPAICYIKNVVKNPNIIIGDYTYYYDEEDPAGFEKHVTHHYDFIGDKLIIGKFCSIGKGIEFIMNGANHPMNGASTYPFYIMGGEWGSALAPHTDELPLKGDTVVGNDVWFGQNVTVLPGVHIGDGAIIGANSVVSSDIPPYAIAAGNPCRVKKMRFDDETIKQLLELKWWDWDIEKISENIDSLISDGIVR